MHRQFFPALDMETGEDIHIVNNFATPYKTTDNLNTEILDANGDSLANGSFSFVVWGVQNKTGQTSHLMLNLPTGKYSKNNPESAVNDAVNYSVYDIPKEFQGVGFLIARFTFVLSTNGLEWTLHETQDLRGKIPNNVAGGGSGGGAETTSVPIGSVMPWTTAVAPVGYLLCNGAAVSRTTYSDLFNIIGEDYGVGDGSSTFNLPDYRGVFLRGAGAHGTLNMANGNDVDGGFVGDENVDQMFGHWHAGYSSSDADFTSTVGPAVTAGERLGRVGGASPIEDDKGNGTPNDGPECYPSHGVINWIIRATNTSVTLEAVTSATIADLIVTNSVDMEAAPTKHYAPVAGEESGGTWHKIADPPTGWISEKTSGWTSDSFSGGLEVDFSSVVPIGTKAVRVLVNQVGTKSSVYYRKSGDSNISNTPGTSEEWSHFVLGSIDSRVQAVIWLSSDYKAQFAVASTATDLQIAYPIEYMI
jgi:microcystin-dependent protein